MSNGSSWLRGAVLYQIYPLSFLDGDGDGWGDLDGVLAGLDHIAALGVDGVWLCPFYPSPLKDFGYDITDHRGVDPRMGDLAALDRIIQRAHALGLKVLVDLVCGHTSDAHPWFESSRRAREGTFADWYVWADARPDGSPPNNWLSVFGGGAWTWEPRRRQYFLHHFLSSQPALNLHHEPCRRAILDNAVFWLERGVDGFRIDAVDFLAHDPLLRSNPAVVWSASEPPLKPFAMQSHHHDMLDPAILTLLEQLRATVDRYPGTMLLGELSSQPGAAQRIAAYTQPGRLDVAYSLGLAKQGFSATAFARMLTGAPDPGALCWSFSNHDVERAVSRWLPTGADPQRFNALLAALFATLPGTLCLYQGEELALPQAELPHENLRDPFGIAYWPEFKGRDGSRTPIPWRAEAANAGFSIAAEPWLPVPDVHYPLAIDRQERREDSPLAVWRKALSLRRAYAALSIGAVDAVEARGDILAFERAAKDESLLAVFNLTDRPAEYAFKRKQRLLPCALPRAPGVPAPEITADGRILVLPPLSAFLGVLG